MRWIVIAIVISLAVNVAALVLYHLLWDAVERSESPDGAERSGDPPAIEVRPARGRRLLARLQAGARQRAK